MKTLQQVLGVSLFEYHDDKKIYRKFYSSEILGDSHRLVEAPCKKLKHIQRRIVDSLLELDFPDYLLSVKRHSFIDNAIVHSNARNFIIKIDISKFFPNTARDKVYKFWKRDMKMSSSVASLMTNLTTVTTGVASEPIKKFYTDNGIICENHLPTGAPSSSILAYLVNEKMFDEIQQIVKQNNGIMTVYVDDITISMCNSPTDVFISVRKIIFSNGYRISNKKSSIKTIHNTVEITGLVHTRNGQTRLPNRIYKRISELRNSDDPVEQEILQGLLQYKRQFEKRVYHKKSQNEGYQSGME